MRTHTPKLPALFCHAKFKFLPLLLIAIAIYSLSTSAAPATPPAPASADAAARIAQLRAEISRHDELYYKNAAPEISDTAYDALKRELRELEAADPELADANSPTNRVDDDAPDAFFQHYPHRAPMLSLDNTYTEDDIRAFDQRVRKQLAAREKSNLAAAALPALRYTVEPKIDGAGISLIYERGTLTHVLTRGNGAGGDDIIANTRAIAELPRQLRDDGGGLPDLIEIRGEIHMTFADFDRVNEQRDADGRPLFANPRNLAAGTMKLHDPTEVASRALHIFVYGIGACEPGAAMRAPITSQHELLARLRAWGLPVIENYTLAETPDALLAAIAKLAALRPKLAYPIDGAVVKVDDFATQQILGAHATAPRWAIAYKYTPKSVETRVRAITLQVGRTGAITPVAELEPVAFDGSKISRVTLHNTQELQRKDVRVGDLVVIEKAGDIIPQIARVKTEARAATPTASTPAPAPYALPTNCPICGTPLVASRGTAGDASSNNNSAAAGALLRCPNRDCPAQERARIAYYVSKPCVNIAGLGDATIGKLIASGLVRNAADLYDLTPQQLATLDGLGAKTAARLQTAIAASRRADLWRMLAGLGMTDVAAARAKILAKKFPTLTALAAAAEPDIAALPGIGPKAAANIAAWLSAPSNREMVERIEKHRRAAMLPAPAN